MIATVARTYDDLAYQLQVINALIFRELQTRFGRYNVGFLWMIGEPLMLASVISILHIFQAGHTGALIPPGPFTMLGYTVYIIFRGVVNRSESMLESSAPLLYHKMVTPLNLSVARAIVETMGAVCSLAILTILALAVGLMELPPRPLYLFAGIGWMTWFSFAVGLNISALTYHRPTAGRMVHPFTYFMLPASGGFWMLDWLPAAVRNVLSWVPLPLMFEYARYGMFEHAPDRWLAGWYITAWCAGLTYTGLIALRRMASRIHLS